MRSNALVLALLACAGSLSIATSAAAQDGAQADDATLDALIVTAQKREETVQDVPIAITLVNGDQLDRQNIRTISDLSAAAPSFEFVTANNANNGGVPTIRGIGTLANSQTSESSVSVVIDGVPVGRARVDSLFDISRVEVLPGPQGITFGKNASAGVINIVTNAPSLKGFEAIGHADIGGKFNYHVVQGVVNIPLGEQAAVRIAAHDNYNKGVLHNVTRNEDSFYQDTGVRVRGLFEVNPSLSFNLIGDYSVVNTAEQFTAFRSAGTGGFATQITGPAPTGCGITPSVENTKTCGEGPTFNDVKQYGVSGQMDWTLLGDHTLTAIMSYRGSEENFNLDLDQTRGTNASIISTASNVTAAFDFTFAPYTNETTQEEVRLASAPDQQLEYVVGLYHSDSPVHKESFNRIHLGFLPPGVFITDHGILDADLESSAAFGQATFKVTDALRVIGGLRYSSDSIDVNQVAVATGAVTTGSGEETNLAYRLGAQYDLSPTVMTYVTFARGYKGPQVNLPAPPAFPTATIVLAEIPESVEVGIKSSLFDNSLAFDVSVFSMDFKNFQGQQTVQTANGPAFVLGNISSVKSQGVEVNVFGRVNKNLTLNAGFAYTDAKYPPNYSIQCSANLASTCDNRTTGLTNIGGTQLVNTPKTKFSLSTEYKAAYNDMMEMFFQADLVTKSSIRFTQALDPATKLGSQTVVGGRVGVRRQDDAWGISAYVRNLTDQRYPASLGYGTAFSTPTSTATNHTLNLNSFRTFGITLDGRF